MPDRAFTVASDDALVDLIKQARRRLVVISPALTDKVATALSARLSDEGTISISIIVDADPEVYRLGYGTEAALDKLRGAALDNQSVLRIQPGVRIGVVISDDTTMVFSPVPKLIEAGSTSIEKPNAIIMSGASTNQLADAAGAGEKAGDPAQEIGKQALTSNAIVALKADLKSNPPKPFDVARAMRVFCSKLQYVEFEVENYKFARRRVEVPVELLGISDDKLQEQISGRFRVPAELLGTVEVDVEHEGGTKKKINVDEAWLSEERKRIEEHTFVVPRYGRVIFMIHREAFKSKVERFEHNLRAYHSAVLARIRETKSKLVDQLMQEYVPKWEKQPPPNFSRFGHRATKENLKAELLFLLQNMVETAIHFEAPRVHIVYKDIAPESVRDNDFINPLRKLMTKRKVPQGEINSLFATVEAAPPATQAPAAKIDVRQSPR